MCGQVSLLVLPVQKEHEAPGAWLVPEVDHSESAPLALTFTTPTNLAQPARSGDQRSLLRSQQERNLQRPIMIVVQVLAYDL